MIYLDNSSTTPLDDEVIKTMVRVMKHSYGNPSSLHDYGMQSEEIIEKARKIISKQLQCASKELIFTSGGTEANNLAIQGAAREYVSRGKHLITTQVEHDSVYQVCKRLEKEGWNITYLPVDSKGRVNVHDIEEAITEETVLVSVIHVNNEVGTIQPIAEIGQALCRFPKIIFHVDAVQSFGKIPLIPQEAYVDLLSLSAHKLNGPKGVGCLYRSKNLRLYPLFFGGGQEYNLRSGTQNIAGIAGLAKASVLAKQKSESFLNQCLLWKENFINRLTNTLKSVKVNGDISKEGSAPYIISISVPNLKSEILVHALEEKGIYVSTRSACSSKEEDPSRVLMAMGLKKEFALGTIRISMGFETKESEVVQLLEELEKLIPKYQEIV